MTNAQLAAKTLALLILEQPSVSFSRLLAEVAGEFEVTEEEVLAEIPDEG